MSQSSTDLHARMTRYQRMQVEDAIYQRWVREIEKLKKNKVMPEEDETEEEEVVRKKKRKGWSRPAGVSCWSKMMDTRFKEDHSLLWDIDLGAAGVYFASSKHRNPTSIPPLACSSGKKAPKKKITFNIYQPPPGAYDLPDYWPKEAATRYPSRFSQRADEVIKRAELEAAKRDLWAVYPDDGRFRLPLSDEEKDAMRRARLKLKKTISLKDLKHRKGAVLLEGQESDFAEGRDNLLINALLREEIERQQNDGFENMGDKEEDDQDFDAMYQEAIKYDPDYMAKLIEDEGNEPE